MAGTQGRKGRGGWWFLALVLASYALLGLGDPEGASRALGFFSHVMGQILPVLGLVFVLLLVADLLLDEKRIKRHLGSESGFRGWLAALIGGVLSVGPVYAWYAMLAEMRDKGMRSALIAAFLYSRALKLPLLPLMVHYFGLAYTLVLSLYLLLFSVIIGTIVDRLTARRG
jgi:uncharacterized membrane protein YraQ (UPF0718 family)